MNIAIIGYGKMGRTIERIAISRGHKIVAIVDMDNKDSIDSDAFRSADIAIEFTSPQSAVDNYLKLFAIGMPVVSGSTGWTERYDLVKDACIAADGTFLWSSNFSVGVNLFFRLNKMLTQLMNPFPQYHPEMKEVHHIHKLDHPSGTAITLAQNIIAESDVIERWSEDPDGDPSTLLIKHERQGEVPGTHIVTWDSEVDSITITHCAKSREGFALGAVLAAEWAVGRKGVLSMDQMMNDFLTQNSHH